MNTKPLFALLLSMAGLVACDLNVQPQQPEKTYAEVSFGVSNTAGAYTKVEGSGDEDLMIKVQYAVYDTQNLLIAEGTSTNGSAVTMRVPVGDPGYTVIALVNSGSDLADCKTLGDVSILQSRLATYMTESATALEMYGRLNSVTLSATTPCTVPVTRLASVVEIDNIENQITTGLNLKILSMYLLNANSMSYIDGSSFPVWLNKMVYTPGSTADAYIHEDIGSFIAAGSSLGKKHSFYCYPNDTKVDSHDSKWSPRYTRLVIEAEYDGQKCYYPINIIGEDNTLKGGTKYKISSLKITGPGSYSPDKPLTKVNGSFQISVTPWGNGFDREVIY